LGVHGRQAVTELRALTADRGVAEERRVRFKPDDESDQKPEAQKGIGAVMSRRNNGNRDL
jgi:hypothetical protein